MVTKRAGDRTARSRPARSAQVRVAGRSGGPSVKKQTRTDPLSETSALKHVLQSNRTSGCGPAVVATVAGVSEAEAIRAVFSEDRIVSLWTGWRELRRGLRQLGVDPPARVRRASSWPEVAELAIVGIGKTGQTSGPAYHWVIYDPSAELIYDPIWPDPYSPSETRRKPLSYLPIPRQA